MNRKIDKKRFLKNIDIKPLHTLMTKLLTTSMLLFSIFLGYSQSKFEIKKIGSQYSMEQLSNAFGGADFCGSFFPTKRNLIVLNDGSEVELKSGNELGSEGIALSNSCLLSDDTHYVISIWSVSADGYLMRGFDSNAYPTEKEYYHFNNLEKQ